MIRLKPLVPGEANAAEYLDCRNLKLQGPIRVIRVLVQVLLLAVSALQQQAVR